MIDKKIFIACDTKNSKKIINIFNKTKTKTKKIKIGYKIGLEFFYSKTGRDFLSKVKNKVIFLDLKINDIPNTAVSAVESLKDLKNIKYLTVHISGGYEMLKAVKRTAKKINRNLKILGVTILTSFSNKSLRKIGYNKPIKKVVTVQAKLAKLAGLDGVVCSGHEVKQIKSICKKIEIVTPGIRLLGDNSQDQKRIMSPKEAFDNGATSVVIGRSITKGNIKKNIQKLIKSLE